jgi:DNA-binding phage protein
LDAGLCPRGDAHLFTRGLALARMDAVLRENDASRRFMAADLAAVLRGRGVDAIAYAGGMADALT